MRIGELIGQNGEVIHPKTNSDLVVLENGRTVEETLTDNVDQGNVVFEDTLYQFQDDIVDDYVKTVIVKGESYQNIIPNPTLRGHLSGGKSNMVANEHAPKAHILEKEMIFSRMYGQSLCNILPEPSLKQKYERNAGYQKLVGSHHEVQATNGKMKSVVMSGRTIFNLAATTTIRYQAVIDGTVERDGNRIVLTSKRATGTNVLFEVPNVKERTYTFTCKVTNKTNSKLNFIDHTVNYLAPIDSVPAGEQKIVNIIFSPHAATVDMGNLLFMNFSHSAIGEEVIFEDLMILEGDCTSEKFSYFEKAKSVELGAKIVDIFDAPKESGNANTYCAYLKRPVKELTVFVTNKTTEKYPRFSIQTKDGIWMETIAQPFVNDVGYLKLDEDRQVAYLVFRDNDSSEDHSYKSLEEFMSQKIVVVEGDYRGMTIDDVLNHSRDKEFSLTTTNKNLYVNELHDKHLDREVVDGVNVYRFETGFAITNKNTIVSNKTFNFKEKTRYTLRLTHKANSEHSFLCIRFFYDDGTYRAFPLGRNTTWAEYIYTSDAGKTITAITNDSGGAFGRVDWVLPGSIGLYEGEVQLHEGKVFNSLSLNENLTLRSIGDVADTLDLTTNEFTQRVGVTVITGDKVNAVKTNINNNNSETICFECFSNLIPFSYDKISSPDWRISSDQYSSTLTTEYFNPFNGWGIFRIKRSRLKTEDVAGFKEWLNENPITIYHPVEGGEIVKKVNTTITSGYSAVANESLNSFEDGYIQLHCCNDTIEPNLSYEIPTKNSFHLPIKPSTLYTIKNLNGSFVIDGTPFVGGDNVAFTSPSSLNEHLMIADELMSQPLMFEGDMTKMETKEFKGFRNVATPKITTSNSPISFGRKGRI